MSKTESLIARCPSCNAVFTLDEIAILRKCPRCQHLFVDAPSIIEVKKEVNLEEHKKELVSFLKSLKRPILLRQTYYNKLVRIAKKIKKTPEDALEGLIEDMYNHLKDTGEL